MLIPGHIEKHGWMHVARVPTLGCQLFVGANEPLEEICQRVAQWCAAQMEAHFHLRVEPEVTPTSPQTFVVDCGEWAKAFLALMLMAQRCDRNLTQRDVAARLRVAPSTVATYEQPGREPSVALVDRFLAAMGLDWEITIRRRAAPWKPARP